MFAGFFIAGLLAFSPSLPSRPCVNTRPVSLLFSLTMSEDDASTVEALAAFMAQQETAAEELAAGAKELDELERATAEELGLSSEELEVFADECNDPPTTSPVAAMANLMVSQEDAGAALGEGFKELEEIEGEIAAELGVTVEELERVEDGDDA